MTDVAAPQKRKPFPEILAEHGQSFSRYLLDEVPEIEAVAIVFSYSLQSTDLPFAVVLGQNGPLTDPAEIVHMCQQLAKTWNHQMQNGHRCIAVLDDYMRERAVELKKLQDQIDAAQQQIATLQSGSPGTPGT